MTTTLYSEAFHSKARGSEISGMSVRTVERAIAAGRLRAFKIGRSTRILHADLIAWMTGSEPVPLAELRALTGPGQPVPASMMYTEWAAEQSPEGGPQPCPHPDAQRGGGLEDEKPRRAQRHEDIAADSIAP